MRKILFILVLLVAGFVSNAQNNPFPSLDSLERFINRYIRNSPVEAFQNLRMNTSMIGMLRFIQNSDIGSGLDTAYRFNDSTIRLITHAPDTFDVTLRFSGGPANTNIGVGYRWLNAGTQTLRTLFVGYGIIADSTSNANGLTVTADSATLSNYYLRRKDSTLYSTVTRLADTAAAIRADLSVSGDTTVVEKPIYVKSGAQDTIALDYGYGLTIDGDSVLIVDTATLFGDMPASGTNLTPGMNATKYTNPVTGVPYLNANTPLNNSDTFYILASGQSNAGFAATNTTTVGDTLYNPRVQIWDWTDNTWKQAKVGFSPFTSAGSSVSGNAIWYFGKKVQEITGKTVRIVLHYQNSTAISGWFTTTKQPQLDSLIDKATASGIPRTDLFVWIQGENDFATNHLTYITRFDSIKATLRRQAFFRDTTPIVVVGMPKVHAGAAATFQEADKPLQNADANADIWDGYADTDSCLVQADAVHYSNIGLSKIGREKIYFAYNRLPRRFAGSYINSQYLEIIHSDANATTGRQEAIRLKNRRQTGVTGITLLDSLDVAALRIVNLNATSTFSPFTANHVVFASATGKPVSFWQGTSNKFQIDASFIDVANAVTLRLNSTAATSLNYIEYNNSTNNADWRVGAAGGSYAAAPPDNFIWYNVGANNFAMNLRRTGSLVLGANANSSRMLFPNGSFGINKDSTTLISAITSHDILVQDTTGTGTDQGRVMRIRPANLGLVSDEAYSESTWNGVTGIAPSKNAIRDLIQSLGSGITSINSETGPAITLTAINGLTRTTTTNNVEFKLGGTALSETTSIPGGSQNLALGEAANKLSGLTVQSAGLIQLFGLLQLNSESATDANFSSSNNPGFIRLPTITAGRTVTLSPADGAGKLLIIWNENSSGSNWSFTNTVFDAAGTAITNLTNDAVYILLNTGAGWLKIN